MSYYTTNNFNYYILTIRLFEIYNTLYLQQSLVLHLSTCGMQTPVLDQLHLDPE